MGLTTSKFNHKVTKVTPVESKDVCLSPTTSSGRHGLDTLSTFERLDQKNSTWERQLPPLRQTLYGRCPTDPRPISFDISLENGDTSSIIKRHPPRRPQKLEPLVLPTIMPIQRTINMQDPGRQREEQGKKAQTDHYSPVMRQHLQNIRMRERNRQLEEMNHLQSQVESKRNVHREAKIDKHKMKGIKARKVKEKAQKNNEDSLSVEHNKCFNMDHGNSWPWGINDACKTPQHPTQKINKLEMWFKDHGSSRLTYSDSSSSDSLDSWIRDNGKNHHRPPLIRTRAEKIPTFDEFFDREF
ncbi:uncharacterized protein CCDC198 [Spea bombifrons]|uniref:uncharacterized protein CCDC198 n=1 Tax=Spea bombifrons TaxID=233779 RepID=UPI00234B5E82|nr:uncharacterized protein CCDC198 [Spea bombifrons]